MDFTPHTSQQIGKLLGDIKLNSLDELFKVIPDELRKAEFNIPSELSEQEAAELMTSLAFRNRPLSRYKSFLGAGKYKHYVPAAVDALITRGEFLTSYTPYQPEVSQGTLQLIFEYQTMISELTGLPVTNASHYDGATSLAEAIGMCLELKDKRRVAVPEQLHPHYLEVARTYHTAKNVDFMAIKSNCGSIDLSWLEENLDDSFACVVVQTPNYFGIIEDLAAVVKIASKKNIVTVSSCYPTSLAILGSPGEAGAHICVGDGQSLGCYLEFGGPSFGFIAASSELIRNMPGRLVGLSTDKNGKRAFTLTLQTREQHIRRERATSNICTNQSLYVLRAVAYLSLLGSEGLRNIASQCLKNSHYLAEKLSRLNGVEIPFNKPFFNEFLIRLTGVNNSVIFDRMRELGYIAGLCIGDDKLLLCATEENGLQVIDEFVEGFKQCLK